MRALLALFLLAVAPCAAPAAAALPTEVCFFEVVGPDVHIRYCADPAHPECLLYYDRWGHEGEYMGRTCMMP